MVMFKKSLFLMVVMSLSSQLLASELDNEVNSLEMSLRPTNKRAVKQALRKSGKKTIPSAKRTEPIPDMTPEKYYETKNTTLTRPNSDAELIDSSEAAATASLSESEQIADSTGKTYSQDGFEIRQKKSSGLIYRVTGSGGAGFTTFDGNDRAKVIPGSVNNPFTAGPMASVLTDINIGSKKFVIETGVQMQQVGSYTGYSSANQTNIGFASPYGNGTYDESVFLTYVGMPINGKFYLSGATVSSFYFKAGATPNFLQKTEYNNYGATFLQEDRYGGFNKFDVLLQGAIGFSLKIFENFHLVLEGGGFQGVIPISNNFAVYNSGFTAGLGISVIL
jgi:hypothetical protein